MLYKRTLSAWEPVDEDAAKTFKGYKFGDVVTFKITKTRNIKFHRKFFGMINLTYKNQDFASNINDFREAVTIAAGYFNYQNQVDGTVIKRAQSISFKSMDEHDFGELYNEVFNVCLKILGCKSEELENELLKFD